MIHLILTILKMIGIILLVILGVLMAVILTVLLVPIRYRGNVFFENKRPRGDAQISWLFHALRANVCVGADGVAVRARFLCFHLFDTGREEASEQIERAEVMVSNEEPVNRQNTERKQPKEPAKNPGKDFAKDSVKDFKRECEQPKAKKHSLREKFCKKIDTLMKKIRNFYQRILGSYESLQKKIGMLRNFFENEENQQTIRLVWSQIKKLIRHILPRKMNGRVKFGFDDPAVTGQILTYISPFYGWYAETIVVEPVFDEQLLEGELHFSGYVRIGTMFWRTIRVCLNKNFRVLLKKLLKSRR